MSREPNRVEIPVEGTPYVVVVSVDLFEAGVRPRVSAISVEAVPPSGVSPRDVQRLPLTAYIEAAIADLTEAIADPTSPNVVGRQRKGVRMLDLSGKPPLVRVPRGRPERGRSDEFYRDLARAYQAFAAANVRPVPEIARRKRVDENTVHQWVHRARKLGFLPPSRRRREQQ